MPNFLAKTAHPVKQSGDVRMGIGVAAENKVTEPVSVPNNEMYRINLEMQAQIQTLRQEAAKTAKQHAARQQFITPHRDEIRQITEHFIPILKEYFRQHPKITAS